MWKAVEGESFQNKMYYIYTDEKLDFKKIIFWVLILKQVCLPKKHFTQHVYVLAEQL